MNDYVTITGDAMKIEKALKSRKNKTIKNSLVVSFNITDIN